MSLKTELPYRDPSANAEKEEISGIDETNSLIDFNPVSVEDREIYNSYLFSVSERGCENSFANVFMWGNQRVAFICENAVRFAKFNKHTFYSYPIGNGDKKAAIDAIIEDSLKRGIPCIIGGLTSDNVSELKELYKGRFRYETNRSSYDYVYSIDSLATLAGKKYHRKRNHYKHFLKDFPAYRAEPIDANNLHLVREMALKWYEDKAESSPDTDFYMEKIAIQRAFDNYNGLGMEGLMLLDGERVLAITMGSKMSKNTFDVHFEKAIKEANGAYAAINCEFAKYIKGKYPEIEFLNREEDMGLEGLRKAKESYFPHHMVEKYRAHLMEAEHED